MPALTKENIVIVYFSMKIFLLLLLTVFSLQAGEFVQKQTGVDSRGQPVLTWVYQADKKFRRERGTVVLPSSGYDYGYGYGGTGYGGYPYAYPLIYSGPWGGPCFQILSAPCVAPAWLGPLVVRYSRGS